MIPKLNVPELLIIGFLAIVFFGKDKLPEAAESIGKAFRSFKKELSADTEPSSKSVISKKTPNKTNPEAIS